MKKSTFIVGFWYDSFFFIFSPLIALFLGIGISGTSLALVPITFSGYTNSISNLFIGSFTMAHLFIVFFRSHGNESIFKLYPFRFTFVPFALFLGMIYSPWLLVFVSVLATWWDVYHSSLQTFGLGRIYDQKKGNDPELGRRLDFFLNLFLYSGPVLAGVVLVDHLRSFERFERVHSLFFTAIPAYTLSHQRYLTYTITILGSFFLCYYLWSYWKLSRQGYQVSWQKVLLLISTGFCSIYSWGFNTFGQAFFIMNFFHALQYFALVWWSEQKKILYLFHLEKKKGGAFLALFFFIIVAFGYGFWAEIAEPNNTLTFSAILVVSIMHFWYDGFIWSVRKKQI